MKRSARRACVGFASNTDRQRHLAAAVRALMRQFGEVEISAVYRSVDIMGSSAFYWNGAAAFDTALDWSQLQAQLKTIEDRAGRDRSQRGGALVTLDLDLLVLCDAEDGEDRWALDAAALECAPHVLVPLAELNPGWCFPGTQTFLSSSADRAMNAGALEVVDAASIGFGLADLDATLGGAASEVVT